ncbi:MAG TPA: glutamine amidotransferase [Micavibrio sp.]
MMTAFFGVLLMKVTAFRHLFSEGLGSLGLVIEKMGGSYQYFDTYREGCADFDAYAPDLLIVLGGTPGVYQADDYPFLKDEMKIIEQRLAHDLPTLGICLGAQMMAHVLGSPVYPGGNGSEIGWVNLKITEAGMNSPLRHFEHSETAMLQWHGDTFDLPAGATLLASSPQYENQAYRYGENALGLQFHCEVTPGMLQGWSVAGAGLVAQKKLDVHRLRLETEEFGPRLITQAEKFFTEWLIQTGVASGEGR